MCSPFRAIAAWRRSGPRAPRTFDATLGCTDVERVACVNWDKVYAALLMEHTPFDEIAVVLNTTLYVGNTSGSGLIVSRNSYAPAITLHEMGHVIAGLGDEYVDKSVADAFSPSYREGQFPNVTTETDPTRIPWRQWFTDPVHIPIAPGESGVGRFEGAFYAANGYYRPKQDSNMRTLEGPIGEVNAEAWLRALYRAVPPIRAAYPEQRIVSGLAGTELEFEIVSLWSPEVVTVRWYVDGSEIEQARDRHSYALRADGGRHDVRGHDRGLHRAIRMSGAHEQTGAVAWTVSNEPGITVSKALVPPGADWRLDPHACRFFRTQRAGNHPGRRGARGRSAVRRFRLRIRAIRCRGRDAGRRQGHRPTGDPRAAGGAGRTRAGPRHSHVASWLLPDWNSRRRRRTQAVDSEPGCVNGKDGAGSGIRREGIDRAVARSVAVYFLPGAGTGSSSHEPFTLSAQCL